MSPKSAHESRRITASNAAKTVAMRHETLSGYSSSNIYIWGGTTRACSTSEYTLQMIS